MKPKRLNFEEMWKLYKLLAPAIEDREPEKTLLDEVDKLLELSPLGTMVDCLHILYDNKPITDGDEALLMFMNGLVENDFYAFIDFIKALTR